MTFRSFGFYSAIHTVIITAVLAFGIAAQDEEWNAVLTPPEILEENKRTGEETYFENRKDGRTRVTRTTFFRGTTDPWKQRVVTTSNGSTTISSVIWNEDGDAISYTEEEVAGEISYDESKNDINWEGKQLNGTRWFFKQRADGSMEKIEEYLSPVTRRWTRVSGNQPPSVSVPSTQANSNKSKSTSADGSVVKQPAATAPIPSAGNDGKDKIPPHESTIYAPYESPGRDQIATALERNFSATKKQVDRPQYDDNEATRLLKELESISAFAEQEMLKEVPRSARWQRFKDVKDRAERDIAMLKDRLSKTKPETNSLVGVWRLHIDGQLQPGEFRFGEVNKGGDLVNLNRDSKPWVNVVTPFSPIRIVQLDRRAPVRAPFGDEQIQLRGDLDSNRLEFWASKDWSSVQYQITKYALVREEKSR